jgi:subtilisin family serine protease
MSHKAIATTMVDVARRVFGAVGRDIVWAVADSGVDAKHPHFRRHQNLVLPAHLHHADFTEDDGAGDPLSDVAGHGTLLAGIIAGEADETDGPISAGVRRLTHWGTRGWERERLSGISGMAPEAKIVSLKILDENGNGRTTACMRALEAIQEMNSYGQRISIHGLTLGVGYDYEPEWFACGQSPLCVMVDRLVKSGVVVVVAAGNTGWGFQVTQARGNVSTALPFSINDPGNAELAITVGSTHRERPESYGVSWFSSRGPTADGREKPDLVAPGEGIVTCRSSQWSVDDEPEVADVAYVETSGTPMAAAHVSGVIAAYLSVRREAIGDPLRVKETFRRTAVDLRRRPEFQGRGLVNLFHALQGIETGQTPTAVSALASWRAPETSIPQQQPTIDLADQSVPTPLPDRSNERQRGVTLFCSYSQADIKLRRQFERSIVSLLQERRIEMWHDGEIVPGSEWREEINQRLGGAQMIVLLVSPDFIQSPFINKVELTRALERHEAGKARVIPVVLRPVMSLGPLAHLEALPKKARPLTTWKNRDLAWVDVAKGIERALEELGKR